MQNGVFGNFDRVWRTKFVRSQIETFRDLTPVQVLTILKNLESQLISIRLQVGSNMRWYTHFAVFLSQRLFFAKIAFTTAELTPDALLWQKTQIYGDSGQKTRHSSTWCEFRGASPFFRGCTTACSTPPAIESR